MKLLTFNNKYLPLTKIITGSNNYLLLIKCLPLVIVIYRCLIQPLNVNKNYLPLIVIIHRQI